MPRALPPLLPSDHFRYRYERFAQDLFEMRAMSVFGNGGWPDSKRFKRMASPLAKRDVCQRLPIREK